MNRRELFAGVGASILGAFAARLGIKPKRETHLQMRGGDGDWIDIPPIQAPRYLDELYTPTFGQVEVEIDGRTVMVPKYNGPGAVWVDEKGDIL